MHNRRKILKGLLAVPFGVLLGKQGVEASPIVRPTPEEIQRITVTNADFKPIPFIFDDSFEPWYDERASYCQVQRLAKVKDSQDFIFSAYLALPYPDPAHENFYYRLEFTSYFLAMKGWNGGNLREHLMTEAKADFERVLDGTIKEQGLDVKLPHNVPVADRHRVWADAANMRTKMRNYGVASNYVMTPTGALPVEKLGQYFQVEA